jgi:tetratricopeptide (TPR) repeat protein
VAAALHALGWVHSRSGSFAQADPLLRRALSLRTQLLGAEHPETAQTLSELAFLRLRQGRIDEAEELNRRVLGLRERALGVEGVAVAESLNLRGLIRS